MNVNKWLILLNLILYLILLITAYILICFMLSKIISKVFKFIYKHEKKLRKKPKIYKQNIAKPKLPPPLMGEELAALSQIDAWKNQILANTEYVKHLRKEITTIKTSTITVNGDYDYLAVSKLHKKITATESQSASIEMRMRKLADKYNLQKELDTFDANVV